MKDIHIETNTFINPLGRERFFEGKNHKAVLLLHGYTGVTHEMKFLGQKINKKTGYSVYIPRLPGHATTTQDFRESKARDWLRKTYDSYLKLKTDFKNVSVIGLSMGGLLALLTAARFKPEKLVTIAAALHTRDPLVPLTPFLKHFIPAIKQTEDNSLQESLEYETEAEKKYYENYHSFHYTAQIAELYKLMRLTRKKLAEVTSKTLIISSKKDELVPLKAAHKINQNISSEHKERLVFSESPHVINDGPEREECAQKIIDFLLSNQ